MTMWYYTRKILLELPEELLIYIDEEANRRRTSRSDCMRQLLREAIADNPPELSHKAKTYKEQLYFLDDS